MAPTNNKTVYQTSFTPYREQPRSIRIVVAYPRPAFSATNRTNSFQPVLINKKSKFLKATHRTKIRKIEIPRSMVVEALSWWSRRASQHPAVQSPVHPWKSPTNLARSPLHVALVGRKMTAVRDQLFPQKPPGSRFDSRAQGFSPPLARQRSSCPPPSPNLVRTHLIENYQALRDSSPCLSRAATLPKATKLELERGAHLKTPSSANHTAAASQPTGQIAKAASWLHLSRVSPALLPPERPSHTHTPKPGFGGRGHESVGMESQLHKTVVSMASLERMYYVVRFWLFVAGMTAADVVRGTTRQPCTWRQAVIVASLLDATSIICRWTVLYTTHNTVQTLSVEYPSPIFFLRHAFCVWKKNLNASRQVDLPSIPPVRGKNIKILLAVLVLFLFSCSWWQSFVDVPLIFFLSSRPRTGLATTYITGHMVEAGPVG